MNEVSSSHRGRFGGRGRGRGRGRGFGGRGRGRFNNRANPSRNDSTYVTLNNGQRVEFHPDITYTPSDYHHMKREDRERLNSMRREKKEKESMKRRINELQSQVSTMSQTSSHSSCSIPNQVSLSSDQASIASQTAGSGFSGRNSQLKRNKHN